MTRDDMRQLTEGAPSLSEKIRRLHDAGVSTADISAFVERRYQHIYNVIKDYERRKGEGGAGRSPVAGIHSIALGRDGALRLPADWLAAQGLSQGDVIICRPESGGLLLLSRAAATELLRDLARKRMPEESALFDALLGGQTEK